MNHPKRLRWAGDLHYLDSDMLSNTSSPSPGHVVSSNGRTAAELGPLRGLGSPDPFQSFAWNTTYFES